MNRVTAALIAIVMVLAAVLVRNVVLDDDADATDDDVTQRAPDETFTIVCSSLASRACADAFPATWKVGSQEPGTLADSLVAERPTTPPSAVVATRPWIDVIRARRAAAGLAPLLSDAEVPLARSPVVFVVWTDRAAALRERCGEIDWACLADVVGRRWVEVGGDERWGTVDVGHAEPGVEAGLFAIASAATGFFGNAGYAAADLRDDEFLNWFTSLERTVGEFRPPSGTPLAAQVLRGPSSYDLVISTEAMARALVEPSARRDDLEVIVPSPVVTADLVAVPLLGSEEALDGLDPGPFGRAGWRAGPGADGDGPSLPDDDGLPSTGVLDALMNLWQEVTR